MLDETTCPICGKVLGYLSSPDARGIWAVAHYLAHLVQQKQPQVTMDEWESRAWKVDPMKVAYRQDRSGLTDVQELP